MELQELDGGGTLEAEALDDGIYIGGATGIYNNNNNNNNNADINADIDADVDIDESNNKNAAENKGVKKIKKKGRVARNISTSSMEDMALTKKDYEKILKYYGVDIPNKTPLRKIRQNAEQLLANKLCRCIKGVGYNKGVIKRVNNPIAVCSNAVLTRRGLTYSRITCKRRTGNKTNQKNMKIKKLNTKKGRQSRRTRKITGLRKTRPVIEL